MDAFAIWFELDAREQVLARQDPEQVVSWFGLTLGRYDLIVGEHRLFSLANQASGVEYPVAQLWSDLISVSAGALQPLPPELANRAAHPEHWRAWVDRVMDLDDFAELDTVALDWWFERQLSAMHLFDAPTIQFWRTGDVVRVHWYSRPQTPDSIEWSSPSGDATVSAAQFHGELLEFDRRLLLEMDQRLAELEGSAASTPTGFKLFRALRRDHVERSRLLHSALTTTCPYTPSWDVVLEAILALERGSAPRPG